MPVGKLVIYRVLYFHNFTFGFFEWNRWETACIALVELQCGQWETSVTVPDTVFLSVLYPNMASLPLELRLIRQS